MKKGVKKNKLRESLEKTLGLLSAGAIAGSIFMGYNRITGNAIATGDSLTLLSIGGIALFVLGILGIFLVAKK
jgi:hypothetical protein